MKKPAFSLLPFLLTAVAASGGEKPGPIRLPQDPDLSPDGSRVAFSWRGDLWEAPAAGGTARRLTYHPAPDRKPLYSPDGKWIAFASGREGGSQIFVMDRQGGRPRQVTHHSEGALPLDWFPGSEELLFIGARDQAGMRRVTARLFRVPAHGRGPERLLFDAYVGSFGAQVSPDGTKILFTREGEKWWRKGYRGALASQVWLHDLEKGGFRCLSRHESGDRWPFWSADGRQVYFASQRDGTYNLWRLPLAGGEPVRVTALEDDGVHHPAISADGRKIVFRRLFDLHLLSLGEPAVPRPLELRCGGDNLLDPVVRMEETRARSCSFTGDGKQVAFVAGHAVWVMDTVLREPVRVTPRGWAPAGEVCFLPDGMRLLFTSMEGGEWDIWEASRADVKTWWWRTREFKLKRLTDDPARERSLAVGPAGKRVAFVKGDGDLWIMADDGTEARRVLDWWRTPGYAWSPDGKWFALSLTDPDMGYARNIWLLSLAEGGQLVNLSMHPNADYDPVWSADGRRLAWVSRRYDNEPDICYLNLRLEEEQEESRDRKLEKAIEAMGGKKKKGKAPAAKGKEEAKEGKKKKEEGKGEEKKEGKKEEKKEETKKADLPEVEIDLEGIHRRIHRIPHPDNENNPFWGPKPENLYFSSGSDLYLYSFKEDRPRPKKVGSRLSGRLTWLAKAKKFACLSGGKPGLFAPPKKRESFAFEVSLEVDYRRKLLWAFTEAWRTIRDSYYDPRCNKRDWAAIRAKYGAVAPSCLGKREFGDLVNLMLGELNGSHHGFYAGGTGHPALSGWSPGRSSWRPITWHLGVIWDRERQGPGLAVKAVIPRSPAAKGKSLLQPGDTVLTVNGEAVDATIDETRVFNRPERKPFLLEVRNAEGKVRKVEILPVTYGQVRRLVMDDTLQRRRERVEKLSGGKLGYLHVAAMNSRSFHEFQADLYAAGYGRQGLVIDVRNNGGGNTADRLLTALCQPRHAVTIPRDGKPGYPRDRIVYARWNRPIVVLCNQSSYSNAEIFSHAVKSLGRGELVGVPTAGGVISTGAAGVLDMGYMRLPGRGWFLLKDGEDMELNGARPDHIVWPEPEEDAHVDRDRQLAKAVEVLLAKVEKEGDPFPRVRYAADRKK